MKYYLLMLLFPIVIGLAVSVWVYNSIQTYNGLLIQSLEEIERLSK